MPIDRGEQLENHGNMNDHLNKGYAKDAKNLSARVIDGGKARTACCMISSC